MAIANKQLVSVRLNRADLTRVRQVAERLQVRESDVIRFAIKTVLNKITPLHDAGLSGSDLLPAFIELGAELTSYFELNSSQLGAILNGKPTSPAKRVDDEDIALLAMLAVPEHYLYTRLLEVSPVPVEAVGVAASLRQYLYDKYIRPGRRAVTADLAPRTGDD